MEYKQWKKKYRQRLLTHGFPTDLVSVDDRKRIYKYVHAAECSMVNIIDAIKKLGIEMKNITATEISRSYDNCMANLQPATCTAYTQQYYIEQEGINPMYPAKTMAYATSVPTGDLTINLAPAASASVSSKSDVAIQRDYLMSRLSELDNSFRYGKFYYQMRTAFNLDINNRPKTSQELLDAIKGGKFKMDDRILKLQAAGEEYDEATDSYIGGLFDAFIWDGPMPDKAGFDLAREAIKTQLQTAKDTIIVKSPDDGLAAIQALEAWTPTGKAN